MNYFNFISKKNLIVISIIISFYLVYFFIYSARIPPNTYFSDINLSGKQISEVENLISEKIDTFAAQPVVLDLNGQIIQTDIYSMGIKLDKEQTFISINDKNRSDFLAFFQKSNIPAKFTLNSSVFANHLDQLFNEYEQSPVDATIVYKNGKFEIAGEKSGFVLNRNQLELDLIKKVENLDNKPLAITLYQKHPRLLTSEAETALEKVTLLNKQKILLTYERDTWSLSGNDLIDILKFFPAGREDDFAAELQMTSAPITIKDISYAGTSRPILEIGLDSSKLDKFIEDIAELIDRPTIDATLKFEAGKIMEFTPARNGRILDTQLTKQLILNKVSIDEISVEKEVLIKLPVTVSLAKIDNEEINSLGIKELLGSGLSYFAGSIANRIHNLTLGSQRISGTLVKPGETFSFNQTVGEVSAATGYKQAYVISKGRTVLDDGGGMCQVSTTVFRSALNSGLPIIARTAHAYRVGYYEQKGFKAGLDATVWAPSVDLKFKNDTQNHILVQAIVDRSTSKLEIDIYGTSDGRKVEITEPVISNQKPPPEDKYEEDPTIPKGTVKQVDFAASGATSVFARKVYKNDVLVIDESFKSVYRPWQAVYLVGTGG